MSLRAKLQPAPALPRASRKIENAQDFFSVRGYIACRARAAALAGSLQWPHTVPPRASRKIEDAQKRDYHAWSMLQLKGRLSCVVDATTIG